jgi:hypothetical protein
MASFVLFSNDELSIGTIPYTMYNVCMQLQAVPTLDGCSTTLFEAPQ